MIPPGSLQHPASQGARGTLAVLPAVGTGRGWDGITEGTGVEGTLKTTRASRLSHTSHWMQDVATAPSRLGELGERRRMHQNPGKCQEQLFSECLLWKG